MSSILIIGSIIKPMHKIWLINRIIYMKIFEVSLHLSHNTFLLQLMVKKSGLKIKIHKSQINGSCFSSYKYFFLQWQSITAHLINPSRLRLNTLVSKDMYSFSILQKLINFLHRYLRVQLSLG